MSDETVPESTPAEIPADVTPAAAPEPTAPEAVASVTPAATPEPPAPPQAPASVPVAEAGAPAQWPSAGYPAAAAYPAQPAYQAPGYGAYPPAPAAQTSNNAVVALILAVVSWVVCPLIAAIVALVFANMAGKEIEASGGRVQGQGLVTASRWVAWINIGFVVAGIVMGIFVVLLIAIAGGMNSTTG